MANSSQHTMVSSSTLRHMLMVRRVGCVAQVKEAKGLDMVRRDWCTLAKGVGNYALDEILSGRPAEDVVDAIHARLRQVWHMHRTCQHMTRQYMCPKTSIMHAGGQRPPVLLQGIQDRRRRYRPLWHDNIFVELVDAFARVLRFWSAPRVLQDTFLEHAFCMHARQRQRLHMLHPRQDGQ